jgi:hypothetical protein
VPVLPITRPRMEKGLRLSVEEEYNQELLSQIGCLEPLLSSLCVRVYYLANTMQQTNDFERECALRQTSSTSVYWGVQPVG